MISLVRKIVAGPKNRTNWKGIDLDLTYITERIIAMAYPASGFQKTYRNSIHDVSQYFKEKHNGNCFVINVSMRKYDYQLFGNLVNDYFWPDHQAPPLTTLIVICNDILNYMKCTKDGVVAVHCNHGKGRTGTCIIAYMLFTNQFKTAQQALSFYNKRRFIVDTYGVDQPCQRRYLDYVQNVINNKSIQKKLKAFKLVKIRQTGLQNDGYYLQISLTRNCQTKHTKLHLNQILKNSSIPILADIFIEIYQNSWIKQSQAARINFNLNFLQKSNDGLYFVEFNGKNICVNGKRNRNFTITLFFKQFCDCHHKLNNQCECFQDRERQQKYWDQMLNIINKKRQVSQNQLDSYVYGPNQKKNYEKSEVVQQSQGIMLEQMVKPINQ